jgi:thymidylate kinase
MDNINSNPDKYYLHIEGMDLAGKSTASKIFAQISGIQWIIHDKRLTQDNPIYDFALGLSKKDGFNSEALGYMYLAALMQDIKNFKLDANIIQDSTLLLRSLNYYKNVNLNNELAHAFSNLIQQHPTPNKSFYLAADICSRRQRLAQRIKIAPEKLTSMDLLIQNDPNRFIQIDESLQDLSITIFNSEVIDTSKMSVMEVVKYIQKSYSTSMRRIVSSPGITNRRSDAKGKK